MVRFIPLKEAGSGGIKEVLKDLKTVPGTCFFIDLYRSTDIKYHLSAPEWITRFHNTFSFISFLNDFPDNIVKGIGDEIMLFIPDEDLKQKAAYDNHFSLLEEIHATIFNIRHFPVQEKFLNCKVAIHYCPDAYNITFFRGVNDFYGKDIDLTARLMQKTTENRIVLSEDFYRKVCEDLTGAGLPPEFGMPGFGIGGVLGTVQRDSVPCGLPLYRCGMTPIYLLLIITVLVSGSMVFLVRDDKGRILKLLLAFSGAFLIGISFLDLVPEVYSEGLPYIGLFVLAGFVLQLLLELLTRGAEHGHEHDHDCGGGAEHVSPFLLLLGLCIHSFLEGMPLVGSSDPELRTTLVTGIIIHNIPISLTLMGLFDPLRPRASTLLSLPVPLRPDDPAGLPAGHPDPVDDLREHQQLLRIRPGPCDRDLPACFHLDPFRDRGEPPVQPQEVHRGRRRPPHRTGAFGFIARFCSSPEFIYFCTLISHPHSNPSLHTHTSIFTPTPTPISLTPTSPRW